MKTRVRIVSDNDALYNSTVLDRWHASVVLAKI